MSANSRLVRVVGNQVWCGAYSYLVTGKLRETRSPYEQGRVGMDSDVAFSRAEPIDLGENVELRYTPCEPLVVND